MFFSPNGFAKDPAVVRYRGKYFLYYSTYVPGDKRLRIGIAVSDDLDNWEPAGILPLDTAYEKNGNGAPAAIVLNGTLHLFYQTYGNWERDAICHATSSDGIRFEKDPTNPVFRPTGSADPDAPAEAKGWCAGRAIDADVVELDRDVGVVELPARLEVDAGLDRRIGGVEADVRAREDAQVGGRHVGRDLDLGRAVRREDRAVAIHGVFRCLPPVRRGRPEIVIAAAGPGVVGGKSC